jgi:hypothetical protein
LCTLQLTETLRCVPVCGVCVPVCAQRARFCKDHKVAGIEDIRTPLCEACGKRMVGGGYKLDGDKRVRWCVQCKPDNAIPGRFSMKKKSSTNSSST